MPKDSYNYDQRVDTMVIEWLLIKNGLWAYMYDLGVSNGKIDPKIRIYMKNRVVECYAQRKSITQMISLCQSMKVNGGLCRLAIMMMWHCADVVVMDADMWQT